MLLAARALGRGGRQRRRSRSTAQPHKGQLIRPLSPAEVKDGALVITNESDAAVDAVVSVIGAALTPEPAVSKGFTIERTYYTLDGKKVDLASATGGTSRAQAERPPGRGAQGGVARDRRPHPAGRPAAGRPRDREPAPRRLRRHQDARLAQDHGEAGAHRLPRRPLRRRLRLLRRRATGAAAGATPTATRSSRDRRSARATVAYLVRAVTPGSFVHPAATVEDMYRPDRFARTASGRLDVKPKE